MHDFRTRQALNGKVETDWNMRADARKLVESINKAFDMSAAVPGYQPIRAAVRKDGNGIYLRICTYDVDIDRYGNMLGAGSLVVEHLDQKDLLAPKPKRRARSTACSASPSSKRKT